MVRRANKLSRLQIVVKVAIIYDGRVKNLSVRLHHVVGFLRNQTGRLAVLWVDFERVST